MPKLISEFRKLLQCFLEVNKSMTMLSFKFERSMTTLMSKFVLLGNMSMQLSLRQSGCFSFRCLPR